MQGLSVKELEEVIGDKNVAKVGQGKAFKSKWIAKGKDGRLIATPPVSSRVHPLQWDGC